ncbi:MAG: HpcH/HpaI aldolase family protein [Eubacteriales bacterium]
MIRENKVKKILKSGGTAVGVFLSLTDPTVVEVMGLAGFDFVVIDNEHVSMDRAAVTNMIRASEIKQVDITPLIRVREGSRVEILQALDMGALGLQIPNVDTYEQGKEIIEASYYSPKGIRGLGTGQRGIGYGFMNRDEYFESAEKEILTVMQCESMESVKNIDKILEIDDIDVVFIGAMDLSRTMGPEYMGKRDHPEVVRVFNETTEKIIKAGKVAGGAAGNDKQLDELVKLGVRYLTIGADLGFIKGGAMQTMNSYNNMYRKER